MLGRTNLLYVPENESIDLFFNQDYILTSSSQDIIKIENINNVFFAFLADGSVLYGSDITKLKSLKNGLELFKAKHIIFADGVYYMTTIENTQGKAVIYKTQDLVSFEEVVLKTGSSTYYYPVYGIFLKSTGEIVALIEQFKGGDSSEKTTRYLLVTDSLLMYDEHNVNFIEVSGLVTDQNFVTSTTMKKDRIFTYNGSTNYMLTLDGNFSKNDKYGYFAADYFFRIKNVSSKMMLYYSINGVDYKLIEFDASNYSALYIFEYDGYICHIYSCTENGETVKKLVAASTPKGLSDAVKDAITVDIEYTLLDNSFVYKDDYVYLGSTGGIITKAKIESSGAIRPDVSLLKTLSAKQALKEANEYTQGLFAALESRIEALESAD